MPCQELSQTNVPFKLGAQGGSTTTRAACEYLLHVHFFIKQSRTAIGHKLGFSENNKISPVFNPSIYDFESAPFIGIFRFNVLKDNDQNFGHLSCELVFSSSASLDSNAAILSKRASTIGPKRSLISQTMSFLDNGTLSFFQQ